MEDNKAQNIEMRLYELNKSIMGQMPTMDKEIVVKVLRQYFDTFNEDIPTFHMLLSAESRDYTVFEIVDHACEDRTEKIINSIIEVLDFRGPIKDICLNEGCVDIWVNDVFYKLFDYTWGVVQV